MHTSQNNFAMSGYHPQNQTTNQTAMLMPGQSGYNPIGLGAVSNQFYQQTPQFVS